MPTKYASSLAKLAETEFDNFNGYHETTPKMAARIKTFWKALGLHFPGVSTPWSAVFVSYFVKTAGATAAEFSFSPSHAVFVHQAIQNEVHSIGVFRGKKLASYAPKIGDIVQNNRNGNSYDYNFASANTAYQSHSAIVVEEGVDGNGRYVRAIGGNESDTVGQHIIRLNSGGLIVQPKADVSRYICVIANLK